MEPCEGNGIASHVFDTEATGLARYSFDFEERVRVANAVASFQKAIALN